MKTKKHIVILAHLAAIVAVIGWGSSFLSTKILMDDGGITPVEVYTYRFVTAYILLLAITFKKLLADSWRDELTFLVCGVCAGSLYFITENIALQNTTAGNVSLLSSVSPIFTALLMAIFFHAKIKNGVILGSVIAFIGVACIIFADGSGLEINPTGDLLALCASLSWATYTIAVKRVLPLYSTLFITRKLFFYGVITSLPLLFARVPVEEMKMHLATLFNFAEPLYFTNFVFLVVLCSVGAYLIWNEVMRVLGPVAANNYLYGQPLVTMIAAWFILGEHIYPLGYLGCVLIIGGLVISDKLRIGRRDRD